MSNDNESSIYGQTKKRKTLKQAAGRGEDQQYNENGTTSVNMWDVEKVA